jgi:hypothetical protein
MSIQQQANVTCPVCRRVSAFTIWQSVNTTENPEMKEAFRDGSVFRFRCPKCGAETPVSFPCLYHEMEQQMMIYLVDEEAVEKTREIFNKGKADPKNHHYIYRIVTTPQDFIEKIRIFDAGRDDRTVEVYKHLLAHTVADTYPDLDYDTIRYDGYSDDGKEYLDVLKGGEVLTSATIDDALYERLDEAVTVQHGAIRHGKEWVIDGKWAAAAIG